MTQSASDKPGLLLINLGTPDAPEKKPVRRYLKQFLLDPRVIDIAGWKRQTIVRLFILPSRPKHSAEAYSKIWDEESGSPLLSHSEALVDEVQQRLGDSAAVKLAMRYGNPSIAAALDAFRDEGIDRIIAFPLYPQYASSSSGSSIEAVLSAAAKRWNTPFLQIIPPFYDHPAYIAAIADRARPLLDQVKPEAVLFSYHGLPERQVRKSDDSGEHCLADAGCCERISQANRNCYRAQCFATSRLLIEALGLEKLETAVAFQSRLGRDPWIKPYTDEQLSKWAAAGIKRAVILSPAFVADCLETIEELGIRAAEDFQQAGGEVLALVPGLNASACWIDAVVQVVYENTGWIRPREAS